MYLCCASGAISVSVLVGMLGSGEDLCCVCVRMGGLGVCFVLGYEVGCVCVCARARMGVRCVCISVVCVCMNFRTTGVD